ncbi:MAG: PilN domain-containing protein [Frankiaceae bacterium]
MTTQTRVDAPALPRVNLLPPEIADARRFKRVQMALGGAVALAVLAVGGLYYQAHSGVSAANDDVTRAQQEGTSLQHELTTYQNVTAVKSQVETAEGYLHQAMGPQVLWSHYLSDLTLTLPGNVWLTTMQINLVGQAGASSGSSQGVQGALPAADAIGAVELQGSALSQRDVAAVLASIAKEKGFNNSYLTKSVEAVITNSTKKVANFDVTVNVTMKALSGRYLTPMAGE